MTINAYLKTGVEFAISRSLVIFFVLKMPEVNDALFYTDTAGDKAVKSTMNALYVDRVLENNSKQVLNRTRAAASSTVDGLKNPQSKSLKRSIEQLALKKKNAGLGMGSALRAKMVVEEERKQNTLKNNGGFDLWAEQPAAQVSAYVEGQIKKRVKKPIVKDTRPASVPSVAIPHPGVSYKPTENDHHAALIVAAGVEYEKVDRLAKIEQQLAYPAALDDLVHIILPRTKSCSSSLEMNRAKVKMMKHLKKLRLVATTSARLVSCATGKSKKHSALLQPPSSRKKGALFSKLISTEILNQFKRNQKRVDAKGAGQFETIAQAPSRVRDQEPDSYKATCKAGIQTRANGNSTS